MKRDGKWWDETWNPVTGCAPVSAGCENCWAKRMHGRHLWGDKEIPFSQIQLHYDRLEQPLHWRKPRVIFTVGMADLFHPDVPFDFIDQVFATIALCRKHAFMILTKRPERMCEYAAMITTGDLPRKRPARYVGKHQITPQGLWEDWNEDYYPNVWLGTSVEDQATADVRIPELLKCPAAGRFVSIEPMLGDISFSAVCRTMPRGCWCNAHVSSVDCSPIERRPWPIGWVIAGAESGPGARPMDLDWVRSIREQCVEAGVPLFFKQAKIDGKMVKMPELDGKHWDQRPEELSRVLL